MKTYIIYNKPNSKSVKNAELCLRSFFNFPTWNAQLFDGCYPDVLESFEKKYNLKDDRARYRPGDSLFKSKKSCFYSHFNLWNNCIDMDEPISIVEHDTYCSRDLPEDFVFEEVVQFSAESIFNCGLYSHYENFIDVYRSLPNGLHLITKFPKLKKWGHCIASNTAYAITPTVAKILVDDCFKNGWQQNDLLMSDKLCKIEIMKPSLIVYDPTKEIHSSSMKA